MIPSRRETENVRAEADFPARDTDAAGRYDPATADVCQGNVEIALGRTLRTSRIADHLKASTYTE
jgi:hypothetical protein